MQKVGPTCLYLVTWTCGSCSEGQHDLYFMVQWFWRLFDVWTSLFGIVNQYDLTFHLKINVGHCDLYFMVQWFLPYILKTIWCMNILISNCDSVWPYIWPQNMCRSLWPIFHGPVIFALYLEDYLIYEQPYLGLWISMTRRFTSK